MKISAKVPSSSREIDPASIKQFLELLAKLIARSHIDRFARAKKIELKEKTSAANPKMLPKKT